MQIHLGSRSGQGIIVQEDDVCTHDPDADFMDRLKKSPPMGVIRIRYKCKIPSVGSLIAIVPKQTCEFPFTLNTMEVVVVGRKVVMETDKFKRRCQQRNDFESDGDLVWCEQCLNSLPPTCENDCKLGYYGINCQQKNEPSINNNRYLPNGTLLEGSFDINTFHSENVLAGSHNNGNVSITNISLIIACIIIFVIVGAVVYVHIKKNKKTKTILEIDLMTRNNFIDAVPPPLPPPRPRVNDHENVYCDIDQLHTEMQIQKPITNGQHLKLGHSLSLNTVLPCVRPQSRHSLSTLQSQGTMETYLTPVNSKYLELLPEMSQKHVEYFDVMSKGYDIPLFLQNGMAKSLLQPINNDKRVDSDDALAASKCKFSIDGYLVPSSCRLAATERQGQDTQLEHKVCVHNNNSSADISEYVLGDIKDHYSFSCEGETEDLSDGYYMTSESGYSSF
jgi:hypothetical protein